MTQSSTFTPEKQAPVQPKTPSDQPGRTVSDFRSKAAKMRPRIPKRGAHRTQTAQKPPFYPSEGLFLDYLRGTIPPLVFRKVEDYETGEVVEFSEPNHVELNSIFGPMEVQEFSSARGYDKSAVLPCGGTVHWHTTRPEQKVLINLGGEALANLGMNPLVLMTKLNALDFQVTRMDWAKDDTKGLIDLGTIRRKLLRGEVATHFTKWGTNESGVIGEGAPDGETIYIGNRQSESFVRCYDKAAQNVAKNGGERLPHWARVELEIKRRKAQVLWAEILQVHRKNGDVAALILGLMLNLVDFKEPGVHKDRRRWETCPWWSEFLGIGAKVPITVPKSEVTLIEAKRWLLDQVGITAAMVKELDPGFIDFMFASGNSRRKKSHEVKLRRWKTELNSAGVQ